MFERTRRIFSIEWETELTDSEVKEVMQTIICGLNSAHSRLSGTNGTGVKKSLEESGEYKDCRHKIRIENKS